MKRQSARQWLRANGYNDVADKIEEIMNEWREADNRQRRDWWAVLAGRKDGAGCVVADRTFPVIASVQKRQGIKVSEGAVRRKKRETKPPPVRVDGRWPQPTLF